MGALNTENPGFSAIATLNSVFEDLLAEATTIRSVSSSAEKRTCTIGPPLNASDFNDIYSRVETALSTVAAKSGGEGAATPSLVEAGKRRDAVVETSARDIFAKLSDSVPIHNPEFSKVWNLFDIIVILSQHGQCNTALVHWLVEELLDRQTIADCRPVFDWLESRRNLITPEESYKQWSLVLLRCCNELLRRLSRAEDTAFCGRVFIFLFQCFPLGDRSSVNLRGEYHVDNETQWETTVSTDDVMDIDPQSENPKDPGANDATKKSDEPLSSDALYALFWPLQETFSQPLKLLQPSHMQQFKMRMEQTVKKFETFPSEQTARSSNAPNDPKTSLKRKREGSDGDLEAFNPKYLSSRDLFELEISDLTFRRHILVQALIILNFILSWTADAKKKYETINATNKSVIYSGEFTEDDAKWAKDFKQRIADHMRRDTPGRLFHRMVDTVLARDKNWVYWKMANCPLITRSPVAPSIYKEAQDSAKRLATHKRLRPHPMGAVNLDFLLPPDTNPLNALQNPDRYTLPDLDTFKVGISNDDFEISMPTNDQTKTDAIASKASKSWRALRIAGRFKLSSFDKIDDQNNIGAVFEETGDTETPKEGEVAADGEMPTNTTPLIIAGPPEAGTSTIIERLLDSHKGVFSQVVRHTTRQPVEGEVNGKAFHFVKAQEFNQLRDGDRLIEYSDEEDVSYGTSTKAIEAVKENGKVPIIELNIDAAQFAKDMDFEARYILIRPFSPDEQLPESKISEIFDTTFTPGASEAVDKLVADYIYERQGDEKSSELPTGASEEMEVDR